MTNEPILPKGWTYLRHGSSIDRWNQKLLGHDFIVGAIDGKKINYNPLCCVERVDAIFDYNMRGFNTASTYGGINGNFEIRVLFYEDINRGKSKYSNYIKSILNENEINEIRKYYSFQEYRHPAVPIGTELIYLSTTDYDEITNTQDNTIFWYIPRKYLKHYKSELLSSNYGLKTLRKPITKELIESANIRCQIK
ncbi:MAG: hypothetical protein PHD78_04310 [Bacilli bacterium]|nr:hypothetical protein [Bacilli bacterium]MDD4054053.1 hypothetical protein [Bacilli bacterium]MDD4411815.1 hypothetical protein [Bacilli bacterium]